jgi:hypothetical protein
MMADFCRFNYQGAHGPEDWPAVEELGDPDDFVDAHYSTVPWSGFQNRRELHSVRSEDETSK